MHPNLGQSTSVRRCIFEFLRRCKKVTKPTMSVEKKLITETMVTTLFSPTFSSTLFNVAKMSNTIEEISQQPTEQRQVINDHDQMNINVNSVKNHSQFPMHTNINHNTFPSPFNFHQPPYYKTSTQYPNQFTNLYNNQYQNPYQNPYQTPTQPIQKQYETQTQHEENPVIIPVKLKRSKTLKNKDKRFLLALQQRYPLASRYGKIEFNINLFEELDSDDDIEELDNDDDANKEITITENTITAPIIHSDDTIKNVLKWILINGKTCRTKIRLSIQVDDAISLDIFKMLDDFIFTTKKIYKFKDGIFCGTKVVINGKLVSPHVRTDLVI
eukprot:255793_1